MADKRIAAAALQYSKWLSRFICWIWATHRFFIYILAALVPEAAQALVSSIGTLDTIMIINEGTYLINSLGEKYIYSERFVLNGFKNGWFGAVTRQIELAKEKLRLSQKKLDGLEEEIEEVGDEENG